MKNLFFVLLVLFVFVFIGCKDIVEDEYVVIVNDVISDNYPLKIETNFNFNKAEVIVNEQKMKEIITPGEYFIKNIHSGDYQFNFKFYDQNNNLIYEMQKDITYSTEPPIVDKFQYDLVEGILKIVYELEHPKDYSHTIVLKNNNQILNTKNKSININIEKNSGVHNYIIEIYNVYQNKVIKEIIIDTSIDNKPKILSNQIRINFFSKLESNVVDDWDSNLDYYFKTNEGIFPPHHFLTRNTNSATLLVFDSVGNYSSKKVSILKDQEIATPPRLSSRLISKDVQFFSWEYDPSYERYSIEKYDDLLGYREIFYTDSSFISLEDEELFFVRKLSNNNNYGFPSAPVFLFSDRLLPFGSGILGNIMENTLLTQINSPFIIASDMIIPKDKTLFVESGSEIRFFGRSRMVVRGTLFIMPGAIDTRLFGNGSIVLDGGQIIISNTEFDNINITGNKGKFIFLEKINFKNSGFIRLNNVSRLCLYQSDLYNSSIYLENIKSCYIFDSKVDKLDVINIHEKLIKNSKINNIIQKLRTRTVSDNNVIGELKIREFSYFLSLSDIIEEIQTYSFSIVISKESDIRNKLENGGTIIE